MRIAIAGEAPCELAPIRQASDFTTGVEIQTTTSASAKARNASGRFGMLKVLRKRLVIQ